MTSSGLKYGFVLLMLLSFVSIPFCASGQEDNDSVVEGDACHSLGVSIGVNDFHIQDIYLTPFVYSGRIFSSRVSYDVKLEDARHNVEGSFGIGHIESDAQARDVTQYVVSVSYAYLHSLHAWEIGSRTLEVLLGGGVSSFVTNTDIVTPAAINWYASYEETWYWSHALNIQLCAEYRLSERTALSVRAAIPIFSIVSRPDYAHYRSIRNAEVDGNFLRAATKGTSQFLWDNFALLCTIECTQRIGEHVGMRGSYGFKYASSDTPFVMKMYMNNFLIGIDWLF